jgi:hypothetical protein
VEFSVRPAQSPLSLTFLIPVCQSNHASCRPAS